MIIAASLIAYVQPVSAQQAPTPDKGTTERAAILNALRPSIEAVLRPPIQFVVQHMKVANGWAFLWVQPQRPGGAEIDPLKTGIAKEWEYMDGLGTYAILWFRKGRWNLVEKHMGPTDVSWEEIGRAHV